VDRYGCGNVRAWLLRVAVGLHERPQVAVRHVHEVGEQRRVPRPVGPFAEDVTRQRRIPRERGGEDGDPAQRQPAAVEVEQVDPVEAEEVGL
jgi:hypothetical protein